MQGAAEHIRQQLLRGARTPAYTEVVPARSTYSRVIAPTGVLFLKRNRLGFAQCLVLPPTNAAGQFEPEHIAGWPRCGVVVWARLFTLGDYASCARPDAVALKILDRVALADSRDSLEAEVETMRLVQPEGFEHPPAQPFLLRWVALCPRSRLGSRLPPASASSYLATDAGGMQLCTWFWLLARQLHGAAPRGILDVGDWLARFVFPTLLRVLQALAYIHDKGVCHLDLDPANVVVAAGSGFDSAPVLKLIDFGSGCCVGADGAVPLAHLRRVKCKIPFRAPEIDHSKFLLGKSCDLWSAGVMLYWMLMPVLKVHVALNFNLSADHLADKDMQIFNLSTHVLAARQGLPHPVAQINPAQPCGLCYLQSQMAANGQPPLPSTLINQFYYLLQPHPRKRVPALEVARRLIRAGVPCLPDGWPTSTPI